MSLVNEFKKQTLTLLTAALGFVAAFIWRDAISAWLAPLTQGAEGPMNLTIAAMTVTIVVIIITIILTKLLATEESKKKK